MSDCQQSHSYLSSYSLPRVEYTSDSLALPQTIGYQWPYQYSSVPPGSLSSAPSEFLQRYYMFTLAVIIFLCWIFPLQMQLFGWTALLYVTAGFFWFKPGRGIHSMDKANSVRTSLITFRGYLYLLYSFQSSRIISARDVSAIQDQSAFWCMFWVYPLAMPLIFNLIYKLSNT